MIRSQLNARMLAIRSTVVALVISPAFLVAGNTKVLLRSGDLIVEATGSQGSQETRSYNLTNCRCVSSYDYESDQVIYVRTDVRHPDGTPKVNIVVADIVSGRQVFHIGPSVLLGSGRSFAGQVVGVAIDRSTNRYFALLADGSTSHTLIRIDGGSLNVDELGQALSIRMIRTGTYKGALVALLRKSKLSSGMWHGFFVIDSSGKELGYIGLTEGEVEEFGELYGAK